jgi:hypothetical protein
MPGGAAGRGGGLEYLEGGEGDGAAQGHLQQPQPLLAHAPRSATSPSRAPVKPAPTEQPSSNHPGQSSALATSARQTTLVKPALVNQALVKAAPVNPALSSASDMPQFSRAMRPVSSATILTLGCCASYCVKCLEGGMRTRPLNKAATPSSATAARTSCIVPSGKEPGGAPARPAMRGPLDAIRRVLITSKGWVTTDAPIPASIPLTMLMYRVPPNPDVSPRAWRRLLAVHSQDL